MFDRVALGFLVQRFRRACASRRVISIRGAVQCRGRPWRGGGRVSWGWGGRCVVLGERCRSGRAARCGPRGTGGRQVVGRRGRLSACLLGLVTSCGRWRQQPLRVVLELPPCNAGMHVLSQRAKMALAAWAVAFELEALISEKKTYGLFSIANTQSWLELMAVIIFFLLKIES